MWTIYDGDRYATSLCLYELQGLVIYVDDHFLPHNVMLPFMASLHNGIHFFVIRGVLSDNV